MEMSRVSPQSLAETMAWNQQQKQRENWREKNGKSSEIIFTCAVFKGLGVGAAVHNGRERHTGPPSGTRLQ